MRANLSHGLMKANVWIHSQLSIPSRRLNALVNVSERTPPSMFHVKVYTQSLPEAPYPDFALRGTSSSAVHSSTTTHILYL